MLSYFLGNQNSLPIIFLSYTILEFQNEINERLQTLYQLWPNHIGGDQQGLDTLYQYSLIEVLLYQRSHLRDDLTDKLQLQNNQQ